MKRASRTRFALASFPNPGRKRSLIQSAGCGMSEKSDQLPLFEVITNEEFTKAQAVPDAPTKKTRKKHNTDDRTLTGWWKLPSYQGFCTVPTHDEVIQALKPEAQAYRSEYPVRYVFEIGEFQVCRDCYQVEADKT